LAIAAVAAEKFNRTSFHRAFEWTIADMVLKVTGHLPDLSLGPAQIRPSTLRTYAHGPILSELKIDSQSDKQLRESLIDECQSLLLATGLLQALANEGGQHRRCEGPETPVETDTPAVSEAPDQSERPACERFAALHYGGQRHDTGAVLNYVDIVMRMAAILNNEG
jgi:hypothetical protein